MSTRESSPTARAFFSTPIGDPEQYATRERQFFSNLILPNGTFKTTSHQRLNDLNALVSRHLPARRPLRLMDVAASSGVSTLEWSEQLASEGVDHTILAGDLLVDAWVVEVDELNSVLVDAAGRPLQYELAGRALRVDLRRRDRIRNYFGLKRLRRAGARVAHGLRRDQARTVIDGLVCRHVQLASLRFAGKESVRMVEDDILDGSRYRGEFDVVRAANILNHVYFDEATLKTMIRNLVARLRPDGLLVICRTLEAGDSHGSLFLNGELGLREIARLGDGSEVRELALACGRTG